MAQQRGNAPQSRFKINKTTTDKLPLYLEWAEDQGVEVVVTEFVGGRDWVVITRDFYIIGPAARGALSSVRE